ncbi:MAG: hypothetical protein QNJ64_08895 [Crocosphaera sp.]|nr:hypothetical protein [Crocosphaera sp.]
MSNIDKFLEQFYSGDGVIRRSFVTGLIFVFAFTINYTIISQSVDIYQLPKLLGIQAKSLVSSTQFLVIAAGFVFAVGSIIDAMVEGFIVPGVSISNSWLTWMFNKVDKEQKLRRVIHVTFVIMFSFLFWPIAIILGTIINSAGYKQLYKLGLKDEYNKLLSHRARVFYSKMNEHICEGLNEPYGDKFESAWQIVVSVLPQFHQLWINRVVTRNKDIASFLSSSLLALSISALLGILSIGKLTLLLFFSYFAICVICYLLFGYFTLIQRMIVSLIEILAISYEEKDIPINTR